MSEVSSNLGSVSVILSDDHAIVRHAIKTILAGDQKYQILSECSRADETINSVLKHKPDLLILDLGLPGKSGIECIHEIAAGNVPTRIVVLTMFEDESKVKQAFAAGAQAYLLKNSSPQEFLSALDDVLSGKTHLAEPLRHLSPDLEKMTKSSSSKVLKSSYDPLSKLSKREREVFYLLADGMPNRVIAKKLFISPRTVETHRARVIKKLGFNSTADLIRYAIRNNLLSL